jgi:hypothetical protein
MARQVASLGINELVLYYPNQDRERSMLERISRNVIPALKS